MPESIQSVVLVDIRDVSVDKSLSKLERLTEFIRQIKNPYHYKCGKFTITAKYTENGLPLEACLRCKPGTQHNA